MMRILISVCAVFLVATGLPAAADSLRGDQAYAAKDFATAMREWREAAEAGDSAAMAGVGTLYDVGRGVRQDFAAALVWYRRAAMAGNVQAIFNVGVMYDSGRGTPVDRAQAIRWYESAASRGNGRAAYNLGVIYRDGDGVERSRPEAIRYFQLAAIAGLPAARSNLVDLGAIAPPLPVPPRPTVTASVRPLPAIDAASRDLGRFQKAALDRTGVDPAGARTFAGLVPTMAEQASKGSGIAQYNVGYAYEHGYGVPRDVVKSYVYYLRATSAADPAVKASAMQGASEISKAMTTEQHATARDMLISETP